jgi:hypothetical protein
VYFEHEADARASCVLNGSELDRRVIRVELAKRTQGHAKTPGRCMFIPISYMFTNC